MRRALGWKERVVKGKVEDRALVHLQRVGLAKFEGESATTGGPPSGGGVRRACGLGSGGPEPHHEVLAAWTLPRKSSDLDFSPLHTSYP